jgi:hypothetical protein
VHGDQNVVVTGTVGRDLMVYIGGRDVREQELDYLNRVAPISGLGDQVHR